MMTMNAERDRHLVRLQRTERPRQRGDAGRHRHRHGEDVVGEQRDAGDLRGQQAELSLVTM